MKKTVLLFFISLSVQMASGQNCQPDNTITQPGYYPEQLPSGTAGQNYSETIQFNIPSDTNVVFGGNSVSADIDSIKVLSVMGLPAGLTYACNPASCVLPGGQTSCGNIYGTIAANASGSYPFVVPIRIYARINGSFPYQQPDTIFKLGMDVDPVGVKKIVNIEAYRVYPNPTNSSVNVAFTLNTASLDVQIMDLQGRHVNVSMEKDLNVLKINSQPLAPGVYYGTATNGSQVYHFKFIKN